MPNTPRPIDLETYDPPSWTGSGPPGPQGPQGVPGNDGATGPPGTTTWAGITDKHKTFAPVIGAGGGDAVAGNDGRLTDARTPTAHGHAQSDVTNLVTEWAEYSAYCILEMTTPRTADSEDRCG